MGLFNRLRRVTTGAVRRRVGQIFDRRPAVDPVVEAELARPTPRTAPTARPVAGADPPPSPADPPAAAEPTPADTVQVVDGPGGKRSL